MEELQVLKFAGIKTAPVTDHIPTGAQQTKAVTNQICDEHLSSPLKLQQISLYIRSRALSQY